MSDPKKIIFDGLKRTCQHGNEALMGWFEEMNDDQKSTLQWGIGKLDVAFLAYKIKHDKTSIDVSEYVDDMEIWEDKHYLQLAQMILDDQEHMWWTANDNSMYTVVEGMIQGIKEEIEFNKKLSEIKQ